jgi:UDP-N-acetylglucosamine--N-acetylmuramyl-(pentapeptide) pyrophosphoryl-undecaprenol N-acetylglucosamine transferase
MEEDLVKRRGLQYEAIPAAGVHGVGWRAMPGNVWKLMRGYGAARRIVNRFHPDVMLFTGGYMAVPMAIAGVYPFRRKIPSVLFVPDIEPGAALKMLARFADRIAVSVPDSQKYFRDRSGVSVTGYPVRSELAGWDLDAARRALGLSGDLPVLLVTGGSTGARSINRAVIRALPELLPDFQIVHLVGKRDWAQSTEAYLRLDLPEELAARYHPFQFLHEEMGATLCSADLALSRAGASTLGEYPAFGLPAVLVPYPHAWQYQQVNAEYLERHGAAVILPDAELDRRLIEVIKNLVHDPRKLEQMQAAMKALSCPEASQRIANMVSSLASEKGV